MVLQYYVIESATGKHINIEVDAASKDDLEITRSGWQTVWDTDFILDPQKEKYVAFLTLKKKSMLPKPKRVKSLRLVPTVFGKEA